MVDIEIILEESLDATTVILQGLIALFSRKHRIEDFCCVNNVGLFVYVASSVHHFLCAFLIHPRG